jgi:short-chain Z-isoprenyl diphosphate synthase
MGPRDALYRVYGWWLQRQSATGPRPRHIAVIMDGNRRWAREAGFVDASIGHEHGAEHLATFLGWCARLGVDHVTAWVASADNIRKRDPAEVAFLMGLAETTIPEQIVRTRQWRIHVVGQMDILPDPTVRALKEAEQSTGHLHEAGDVTIAIGYGGREELVEAVREVLYEAATDGRGLAELAAALTEKDIAGHLYTYGQPPPDLVIRTSGEQRMSDFLLWQAVNSDLHFVDAYWPSFRYVDLLRVLRRYAARASVDRG